MTKSTSPPRALLLASETFNARVDSTFLGKEDHGIPSFSIGTMREGSCHQGFGGYDLRHYGIAPIFRILEVLGVATWEKLKGTPCRVRVERGMIRAIGHFIDEKWYDVEAEGKARTP